MKPARQNRVLAALFLLSSCAAIRFAHSETAPFITERLLLDRISGSLSAPQTRAQAVRVLESIALGRAEAEWPAGDEAFFNPEHTRLSLQNPWIRASAIEKLAGAGLPETNEFLANFEIEDPGKAGSVELRRAARIALHASELGRVPDSIRQIAMLEDILQENYNPVTDNTVRAWAANELCNRASRASLDEIRRSIRQRYSGDTAESEIRFCEMRMDALSAFPARAAALQAALRMPEPFSDLRFKYWAVSELIKLHSDEGRAALLKYAAELGGLREGGPAYSSLMIIRQEILRALRSGGSTQ